MDKKKQQLGMNPSTASGKLLKDLLFDFAVKAGHKCFRCDLDLIRTNFSIEHKIEWLDSQNPFELFFDIDNIAYSHLNCNISAGRRKKATHGQIAMYKNGCRCTLCVQKEEQDNLKRLRKSTDGYWTL